MKPIQFRLLMTWFHDRMLVARARGTSVEFECLGSLRDAAMRWHRG